MYSGLYRGLGTLGMMWGGENLKEKLLWLLLFLWHMNCSRQQALQKQHFITLKETMKPSLCLSDRETKRCTERRCWQFPATLNGNRRGDSNWCHCWQYEGGVDFGINHCSPSHLGHELSCTANALGAPEDTLVLSLM